MNRKTYMDHLKYEKMISFSMISQAKGVDQKLWFASSLEARCSAILALALRDDDLTTQDFRILQKKKRSVFYFYLNNDWKLL